MSTPHHTQPHPVPKPTPPTSSKDDIFDARDYARIDEHAIATPARLLSGSFRQLLTYLTDGIADELAKVRVLFRWLTSVDVYNVKFDDDIAPQSPNDYLRKIKEGTGNHAHLFAGICQMSGICCAIINGMNKSASYEVGKKVDRNKMAAQWNAVYFQGQWRLVDPFWASACIVGRSSGEWKLVETEEIAGNDEDDSDDASPSCGEAKHLVNEFYFLTDPDHFVWTHFPDDAKWQMLETPITEQQFEEHFYIRERFHLLGLASTENSHRKCVLTTDAGQVTIQFALPAQYSNNYKFKYIVYLSRKLTEDKNKFFLERFVVYEQTSDLLTISLRFPIRGTFKFDLFGLDSADTNIYDLVCTYIIHVPHAMPNCLPLPDIPREGWGITAKSKEVGMTPTSHKTGIITTDSNIVNITFNMDHECYVSQRLLHAVIDESNLSNYVLNRQENGEIIISLRLPQKGEYALKIYATPRDKAGEMPTVCNYLIKYLRDQCDQAAFPNVPSGFLGPTFASTNLRVKPLSHPVQIVTLADGKATMAFEKDKHLTVMCEIDHSSHKNYSVERTSDSGENIAYFAVDLPTAGEYAMNVFAQDGTVKNDKTIYHVYSYLIRSKGYRVEDSGDIEEKKTIPIEMVETSDNRIWIPKPDGNDVVATLRQNNTTAMYKHSIVTANEDNEEMPYYFVNLKDYGNYSLALYACPEVGVVQNVARYQINRKTQTDVYQNDINTIMDTVKQSAEVNDVPENYDEISQCAIGDGDASNDPEPTTEVLATITNKKSKPTSYKKREKSSKKRKQSANKEPDSKDDDDDGNLETKKRQCLAQLRRAIEMRDRGGIEANLKMCHDNNIEDKLMEKAKLVIVALVGKEKLTAAIVKRDLRSLEDAIVVARNENVDHLLDLQISIAQKLRSQLQTLERLRQDVLSMDQKTVAELRSYSNPPSDICPVMKATYYLLSNGKILLSDWNNVVVQMSKTGKWSLKRAVLQFDALLIYTDVAACAKAMIEGISLAKIRDVSAGAATFFIWVSGMLDVVEETGGAGESPQGWRVNSTNKTKIKRKPTTK